MPKPSQQPVDTGTITSTEGGIMSIEGNNGNYAIPLGGGVECGAKGFANIFKDLKVLTAACIGCVHSPDFGGDSICEPCNPDGAFPLTMSDVIRGK